MICMKANRRVKAGLHFSLPLVVVFTLIVACENRPTQPFYRPVLPDLPAHWQEILGEPHWRLQWIDQTGIWLEANLSPGETPYNIALMQEWTTPVLAWPYWPERELPAGLMRPSGALFPWDSGGGKVVLSWEGGVDAVFWRKLAAADRVSEAAQGRLPWHMDWPRFRELFESSSENANENALSSVREDRWRADWRNIADRTVQSGFDRRRIAPKTFSELVIDYDSGDVFINSSPFAPPLKPDSAERQSWLLVLSVTDVPDTWVSKTSVIRASTSGFVRQ